MRPKYIVQCLFLAAMAIAAPQVSSAGIFVSVGIAPPVLPIYEQPLCPGDGYIWTPGYWAYGDQGYYWVPGTWVLAPQPGFLWTPAYWGWSGGLYVFHGGYWGTHIGFYGGINYGYGYGGHGYDGGYWNNGRFQYNRSVNNVNVTNIHNVYNKTVINNNVTRTSYNGGTGGISARASAQEAAAEHDRHVGFTSAQQQHQQQASTNRAQFASVNHGSPAVAATPRPGALSGPGVVRAGGGGQRFGQNANPAPQAAHNATPPNAAGQRFGQQGGSRPAPQVQRNAAPGNGGGQRFGQQAGRPAPQVQHNAPPAYHPQAAQPQHYNPAPQQRYSAPAQRSAPPVQRSAPSSQRSSAPRPQSHGGGGGHPHQR